MAPAITPWNNTLLGMGSNNPAIRLYHYSRSTGLIKDYTQYYLNLSDANTHKRAIWEVEYRAQKEYNLTSLSASSLHVLVSKFKETCNVLFQRYYDFNSVSVDRSTCIGKCKLRHICSMTNINIDDYNQCILRGYLTTDLNTENSTSKYSDGCLLRTSPDFRPLHWSTTFSPRRQQEIWRLTFGLLGSALIILAILCFVVAFCRCRHHRHRVFLLGQSRYTLIEEA